MAIGGSLNEIGDVNGCLAEARRTLQPGGRFVAMTLARAESSPGRALQAALGTGGITFWTAADLAAMLRAHNLPTRTQQQYGLVMFHAAQAE
ncbi:hypothetical protein SE17_35355 [Kouleothrix aurantiaca]|uniref:Methyltransferase type 11 domain-containing protein n=1 Tax=Kouleothrix aurantiaca TaxID=186479 RepID=A0A0P9H4N5_9CHLR|nr:hypothetical protein SE17_35355 [Kouleothrix aurantiaca]